MFVEYCIPGPGIAYNHLGDYLKGKSDEIFWYVFWYHSIALNFLHQLSLFICF
jgi:hypothetical protein